MPVSILLVEGNLDVEVLTPILRGIVVVPGGPKYSLPPQVQRRRKEVPEQVASYLRDRDFDSDPQTDTTEPIEDRRHEGRVLGWRWCRHEIESYLIDPELVAAASGWEKDQYRAELVAAACLIRPYQIARWVIGTARRNLPPNYELNTRPIELGNNELRLPDDLSDTATSRWAKESTAAYWSRVQAALSPESIDSYFADLGSRLTEELLQSEALLWCSGKDLLTALEPWLKTRGVVGAREFLNAMRDWVISNPDRTIELLPEWAALVRFVSA